MDYNKIPKIELHLHLDGSIRPTTLARLSGLSLEEAKKASVAPNKCHDLNDYLTRFELPIAVMQTYDNIKLIAQELAEDLKNENVVYAEIRFAPNQHLKKGLTLDEVVEAAIDGLRQVNIKTKLLLSMMRHDALEENKKIVELAHRHLDKIAGIDLAGAEALYPTKNFGELFEYAKELGVPYTIHAGEADGISSIAAALKFGTTRIGHGIRCLEDEETLEKIKKDKILLEICPTSNVQTDVVNNIKEHPFYRLYKEGVMVSINTDNRTVSDVTLTDQYKLLAETFCLTVEDFKIINLNTLEYSFTTDEEKKQIRTYLENV